MPINLNFSDEKKEYVIDGSHEVFRHTIFENADFTVTITKISAQENAAYRKRFEKRGRFDIVPEIDYVKYQQAVVKDCLRSWSDVLVNGKEFPFTEQNISFFLENVPEFVTAIANFATAIEAENVEERKNL